MNRIFLVYEQIVKHYIERIDSHDLNQGDSIESEEDIAAAFSVSRGTVRKAMLELESMGYLTCSKGKRRTVAAAVGMSAEERYPMVSCRVALMLLNRSEYLEAILFCSINIPKLTFLEVRLRLWALLAHPAVQDREHACMHACSSFQKEFSLVLINLKSLNHFKWLKLLKMLYFASMQRK